MSVVLNGVEKIRKLPITAVDDNTTDNDLYVVFAEAGRSKELKISSNKLKFNPSSGNFFTAGDISGSAISGSSLVTTGDISGDTITGTKVFGAVYNDIADFIEVDEDFIFEYGKTYVRGVDYKIKESSQYAEKGIVGIASDTYGFALGEKKEKKQIPIAIGGWVLAYVDTTYPPGTPLTSTADGHLTEINLKEKEKYPERIIAVYDRPENNEDWNSIKVDGRHWVKVR